MVRATGTYSLTSGTGLYPRLAVRWVASAAGTTGLTVPANASWPVPPAYVTSAFLNTNIKQTIQFLTYPPVLRRYYAAGTATLASGTFPAGTVIALDTTTVDTYSGWSSSGNYFAAPVAGCYYLYGQVQLSALPGTGAASCGLSVNGGAVYWGKSARGGTNTSGMCTAVVKRLRLNAGDEVSLMGQQSFGSALTIGSATRLIAVWETA
jgi:hypothetical protein